MNVRDADPAELAGWDAVAVETPGGHVLQSRAWAEHRRASGWQARFLVTDDGGRVLALTRPWPLIRGGSAYVPRGPVPVGASGAALAGRLSAVAERLEADGVDVLAADAEVPAADRAYRSALEAGGFHPIEEIQPSRHRVTLPLRPDVDEDAAFQGISKSTRQRIRGAEKDGVAVVRHDTRWEAPAAGGSGDPDFTIPTEPSDAALDRFYDLLLETGERRHFSFGPRASFVVWWRAALAAGHLVYLEAREAGRAASRSPASSCTGTAAASRPSTRAITRPPARPTRVPSTSFAGGRSRSRSGRAARRWTWAASTRPAPVANRWRAIRCMGCTNTSARSAVSGSS